MAQALTWTLYELSQHPAWEAAVVDEARAAVAASASGLSYDMLNHLTITKAVFLEALRRALRCCPAPASWPASWLLDAGVACLQPCGQSPCPLVQCCRVIGTCAYVRRLHPSVPAAFKTAVNPDVLPDGSPVPAGALVLYSPYVSNRNPNVWGEDAGDFRSVIVFNGQRQSWWCQVPHLQSSAAWCWDGQAAAAFAVWVWISMPSVPLLGAGPRAGWRLRTCPAATST